MKNAFINESANINNPKWNNIISRTAPLYSRNDIRSEFDRDYTRIIHSNGYRRLKHKTQVFFSPSNDHVCTRIEHVNHVESISYTIANYLGLNTELTKAISASHDIGHTPFGHRGERILSEISQRDVGIKFWHEQNGLNMVDNIELLEDNNRYKKNLDLTYGVRDGIICHCGEIDENSIKPRNEFIDLNTYLYPNQYAPYTWEGCVVKVSDKISYIGRDIEDAITLGILDEHLDELYKLLNFSSDIKINNTILINDLVYDLCENSNVENGICFSDEKLQLLDKIKEFNYKYIYSHEKVNASDAYFRLIINEIYNLLNSLYDDENTLNNLKKLEKHYPNLYNTFSNWLLLYSNIIPRNPSLQNKLIYNIHSKEDYCKAIISYISGMTDNFAINIYNEIIGF